MEDWLKYAAKPADVSRQVWRRQQRMSAEAAARKPVINRPGYVTRTMRDLNERHPGILQYRTAAFEMLMTGPKAQKPTFRAVVKMMKAIHKSPTVKPLGLGMPVPAILLLPRHARGSWRNQ